MECVTYTPLQSKEFILPVMRGEHRRHNIGAAETFPTVVFASISTGLANQFSRDTGTQPHPVSNLLGCAPVPTYYE